MVREYTNKLINALTEGVLTHEQAVTMMLSYMSEDDIEDMCRANDLCFDEEESEEEWT